MQPKLLSSGKIRIILFIDNVNSETYINKYIYIYIPNLNYMYIHIYDSCVDIDI